MGARGRNCDFTCGRRSDYMLRDTTFFEGEARELMKDVLKALVIGVICVTLPMPRVYAVVPDAGSIIDDSLQSGTENTQDADVPSEESTADISIPNQDLSQAP